MSRKCDSLDVSQHYGPARPVTGIALLFFYNETVHHLFIDFKKAHGSIRREVLYIILLEFDDPMKLVRLTTKLKN
jgi:hypothetical protein